MEVVILLSAIVNFDLYVRRVLNTLLNLCVLCNRYGTTQTIYASAQKSAVDGAGGPRGACHKSFENCNLRSSVDSGNARHVCNVASGDARDFGLKPVLKANIADFVKSNEDLATSSEVSNFEERSVDEESATSADGVPTTPTVQWSRNNSILWSILEARSLISRYSQTQAGYLGSQRTENAIASMSSTQDVPLGTLKGTGYKASSRSGSSRIPAADLGGISLDASDAGDALLPESQVDFTSTSNIVISTDSGLELDTISTQDSGNSFLREGKSGFIALAVCGLCYLHCSATGFALPALLPAIGKDIPLSDAQGALLTTGYTLLYAAALIPMGILADRVDRPKLLAGGVILWSGLSSMVANANSFGDLILLRVGFAAAQATQNPICMSMLPELFPKNKSTAMAIYNCAIYMGRALSFAFVMLLAGLGVSDVVGVKMLPLDSPDLDMMSILYTTGDKAAVLPVYDYDMSVIFNQLEQSGWRDLLFWLGVPGIGIAALLLFLVKDPRGKRKPYKGAKVLTAVSKGMIKTPGSYKKRNQTGLSSAATSALLGATDDEESSLLNDIKQLLKQPSFQATTFAAAMNDVGGWGLVAWQAIFYERVFNLPSEEYAPMLAAVIPLGGIVGGVGGGLAADWLSKTGNRFILTFGASLLSAPLIYWSFQSESPSDSFFFLLFGFALSECWRAPAAVMVREIAPESMGSTASAVHLCVRNILAGLGPIGVAVLAEPFGLQNAMTLIPASYMLSAVGFLVAEVLIKLDKPRLKTQM